jgi:uncharacterized membrane protein YkoI
LIDVKTAFTAVGVVALAMALAMPADAGHRNKMRGHAAFDQFPVADVLVAKRRVAQVAQAADDGSDGYDEDLTEGNNTAIRPREAARIAKRSMPGARVLKVKLLPSGIYAVTLRGNGELTRVMVDGLTGEIL